MEYYVYECKKALRKYKVHIIIGVSSLVLGGILLFLFFGGRSQSPTKDTVNTNPEQTPEDTKNTTTLNPPSIQTIYLQNPEIIKTYVREGPQYYTQGLIFKDENTLIESAGLYGESAIHYLNFPNMTVGEETKLDYQYFGEGCELIENNGTQEIYQLTWRERKIFVWDATDLSQKRVYDLPNPIKEGWGISKRIESDNEGQNQTVLYISDGTDVIYAVNPFTMEIKRTIEVQKHNGKPIPELNELEFINGYLWANVYMTNSIAVINIDTGYADYWISFDELSQLARDQAKKMGLSIRGDYVLNGIAYDTKNERLIVTGKKWPLMWEIKVPAL